MRPTPAATPTAPANVYPLGSCGREGVERQLLLLCRPARADNGHDRARARGPTRVYVSRSLETPTAVTPGTDDAASRRMRQARAGPPPQVHRTAGYVRGRAGARVGLRSCEEQQTC